MASQAAVRKVYRNLLHLIKQQQPIEKEKTVQELRTSFRRPLEGVDESLADRLAQAEARLGFLRITTAKTKPRGQSGMWVYKDGKRLENVNGTIRDASGKVMSSFDGKNLDPEAFQRHKKQLHRAGFVNNAHAKGVF